MVQLVLILDDLRSAYNVGAILRTADAVGVSRVILAGITPYPQLPQDDRDPRIIARNTRAIAKSALGAEKTVMLEHYDSSLAAIAHCRAQGCIIYGLEQTPASRDLFSLEPRSPAALVVGSETTGLSAEVLAACDVVAEIPQRGHKESLNVSVAAGIALYRFMY